MLTVPERNRFPKYATEMNILLFKFFCWASLIAQLVKNLPAMQETLVQLLSLEDPLEKG